jgi:DNA modification methylase
MITLYKGDCLEVMDELIAKGVVADAIITDPPYGTTACKWDSVIPFDEMWERLNKLIKPNGAIVLFGCEPFSSLLRVSNLKNFKYDWIWEKTHAKGHLNAKKNAIKST